MKRVIILLFFLVTSVISIKAQEKTCSTSETIEDLNTITKCTVEESTDKNYRLTNKSEIGKVRFLRRRTNLKKKTASSGVSITSQNVESTSNVESLKEEIIQISDILNKHVEKEDNVIDFSDVQSIPQFRSCETSNNANYCFNVEMSKHIKKYFTYPKEAIKNNLQGKVTVKFTIDDKGSVRTIQVSGPKNGTVLKDEAKRVINKLPKFIPAEHNGEKVFVRYSVPINFKL